MYFVCTSTSSHVFSPWVGPGVGASLGATEGVGVGAGQEMTHNVEKRSTGEEKRMIQLKRAP